MCCFILVTERVSVCVCVLFCVCVCALWCQWDYGDCHVRWDTNESLSVASGFSQDERTAYGHRTCLIPNMLGLSFSPALTNSLSVHFRAFAFAWERLLAPYRREREMWEKVLEITLGQNPSWVFVDNCSLTWYRYSQMQLPSNFRRGVFFFFLL